MLFFKIKPIRDSDKRNQEKSTQKENDFLNIEIPKYIDQFMPAYPKNFHEIGNRKADGLTILTGVGLGNLQISMKDKNSIKKKSDHRQNKSCLSSEGMIRALSCWSALREYKRKNADTSELISIMQHCTNQYYEKYHIADKTDIITTSFRDILAVGAVTAGAFSDEPKEVIRFASACAYGSDWNYEGIRGSVVIAIVVWMALRGATKTEIYDYAKRFYGTKTGPYQYKFSHGQIPLESSIDEIKQMSTLHTADQSCMIAVPEALINFFNTDSLHDCIAMSTKYTCNRRTVAELSGGLAASYYGVQFQTYKSFLNNFPVELRSRIEKVHPDIPGQQKSG